jgi:MFS family permease
VGRRRLRAHVRRLPDHGRAARRRLGRRRVYVIGLGLFTRRSAACGLAPSPTHAGRGAIAQGCAGAVVMPQVLAIVGVTYKGPDYVRALSIYGVVLGLAAVGGQVVGGALVETDLSGSAGAAAS